MRRNAQEFPTSWESTAQDRFNTLNKKLLCESVYKEERGSSTGATRNAADAMEVVQGSSSLGISRNWRPAAVPASGSIPARCFHARGACSKSVKLEQTRSDAAGPPLRVNKLNLS